jgi:ABC-type lipoprotein release transport system permease subunit
MLFCKLAWRNLRRNPRRAALTIGGIAIGVAALMLAWAVFDGGNNESINNMTGNFTGHLQIHRRGYTDDPTPDRAFARDAVDLRRVMATPGVVAVSPRMEAPVLLNTDAYSRGVLLVGVDPASEIAVTSLYRKIVQGSYLSAHAPGRILVGTSLAKSLKVALGDEIDVITQGMHGSLGSARYTVGGIYDTGNDMVDGLQAFVALDDAQTLFSSDGHLTTLAVKLPDYQSSDQAVAALRAALPPDLEVKGWEQLLPDVAQKVHFHEGVAMVVMAILFVIVMIGITNTILMSVLERVREFGIMMAMGTSGRQLFAVILLESLFIGMIGFAIGLAIGAAAVSYLGTHGIDFSNQGQAVQQMQGVSSRLHPYLAPARMLAIGAAVLAVSVAAAIYPAGRTALMVPLEAIRGFAGKAAAPVRTGRAREGGNLLLRLALRNLGRHPLRTALTTLGITFTLGVFIFLGCFVTGYYNQIVENSTGFVTGDAQIQHQDFKAELKPDDMLVDGAGMLRKLTRMANVKSASPRVQTTAMLGSPEGSEPVLLYGVDPERERTVTFLYKSIKSGTYLRGSNRNDIVIGRKLAQRLHVQVGDKLVVMAQAPNGELASEAFVVSGLFTTGSHGFDESIAHVSLGPLQRMLGMQPNNLTSIAFRLAHPDQAAATLAQVRSTIDEPLARVYPWQELLPEVVQMNTMFKGSLLLVMSIVFLMIAVVIMNTVMMSVMERIREFGAMLALGGSPALIVGMVLLESALLGALGSAVGCGLGTLAAWVHSITGVSMKSHGMTAIPGTTDVIYPHLTWMATLGPALLMPIIILAVSFYPAFRASRLEPVKALKHV